MPIFSRGITSAAKRDLWRILNSSSPHLRSVIQAAQQQLMAEIRTDPHLKGSPAPMLGFPHLRRLDLEPLRMFYWVRQPPLMDLYVEVVGFGRS
jgi:hypothetical protein